VSLKRRLAASKVVVGTFVKTPSPLIVEVLARTPLDCLVLDAEHAPFDRGAIDACLMAARAGGMDVLVRTPSAAPEHILNALDGGATGVLVPHIRSATQARDLVRAAHYGTGGRGYAGSSRAAGYTAKPMAAHLADSRTATVVIAQIEDPEAIDDIDAIAAVEGIDALFIGRADLTVAYAATSQDDARVVAALDRVCAAGREHRRPTGLFLAREGDAVAWMDKGARLFLLGSDHGFLLAGAAALVNRVRDGG
jgi:2-keto-3-deoxy-L-rhamnonate aldolase RhmA